MQTKLRHEHKSSRWIRIAIAGAAGAMLAHGAPRSGECAAAGSDGARAAEDTLRSDPAAAENATDASLQRKLDRMLERRRGRYLRRGEELRRLTPAERRQRLAPPRPRRERQRELNEALERVNNLRRQMGAPAITVEP